MGRHDGWRLAARGPSLSRLQTARTHLRNAETRRPPTDRHLQPAQHCATLRSAATFVTQRPHSLNETRLSLSPLNVRTTYNYGVPLVVRNEHKTSPFTPGEELGSRVCLRTNWGKGGDMGLRHAIIIEMRTFREEEFHKLY
jgi:hypothetical protein